MIPTRKIRRLSTRLLLLAAVGLASSTGAVSDEIPTGSLSAAAPIAVVTNPAITQTAAVPAPQYVPPPAPIAPVPPPQFGGGVSGVEPSVVEPLLLPSGQVGKRRAGGWVAEVLPNETIFREYLADPKAARFAAQTLHNADDGWIWELRAGGRAPLFRFGTPSGTVGPSGRPEGWQVGVEGVATPRLNFEHELDLDYVDYRVGVPITYAQGQWQFKLEPYHLSSHAGDELLLRDPTFERINYVRDALRFGAGYFATPDWRLYGEAEYAWKTAGGAEPWHFQFGVDYSPLAPTPSLARPLPFFAANVGLREEVDFGGSLNVLAGLQWRGAASDHVFRFGAQYYNGKSFQYEIFDEHEELLGLGIWYDF